MTSRDCIRFGVRFVFLTFVFTHCKMIHQVVAMISVAGLYIWEGIRES